MIWLIVALSGICVGGVAWFFLAGIKIQSGWQNGQSPLAMWLDNRRRTKFNEQLPEALATMSNALRAGFSISQAFDTVVDQKLSPISDEFEILQRQLHIGMSFEDALESLAKRVGSDDLTLVTTAILISRKTGGNVTEIFDKISDTIRARMKVERKVRTLTAQGRLQGIIVSAMPIFLGIVLTAIKPAMMLPFLFSFSGLASVLGVLVLIAIGWLVIRKIVTIDV